MPVLAESAELDPTIATIHVTRTMANTVDSAKLASYLTGLTRLSQREREVYTQCLQQPAGSAVATGEAVHTLSRVIETLLEAIGNVDRLSSRHLADLLASVADDPSTEESRALEELRLMDRAATPDTWGKFKILKTLGAGGFGTVYEAWDPDLEQKVALKLYHPDRLGRSRNELLAEARKLVRVRHPNVVVVHSADEHDGRVGVCMELVHGQTLTEVLAAQGPLGPEEATTIGGTLCQALAAVHGAKLTHADIKADNVIRETGGRIVLMDFGSARFRDPDAIQDNRLTGTPRYMAPELFALAEPTEKSDIYALGVLLFYLVTHRFPVDGPSFEAIRRAHEDNEPRRLLRDERPGLPRTFVEAVERAAARDPGERYKSAGLMEQALTVAPRSGLSLTTAGLWVAVAFLTVLALGFVTSGTFHVFLRVPDQFDSTGIGFQWGIRPMVPVLFYWSYLLFVLATLIGLSMLASTLVNKASPRVRRVLGLLGLADRADRAGLAGFLLGSIAWFAVTWSQSAWPLAAMAFLLSWILGFPMAVAVSRNQSPPPRVRQLADTRFARRISQIAQPVPDSPFLPAAVVVSIAALFWLAITWSQLDVFRALVALRDLPLDSPSGLFAPLSNVSQRAYVQAYAYLAFALAFAIRYIKRLESTSPLDPARFIRGALVVVFSVTLAITVLPYRITWVEYERVEYEGRAAFIVGQTPNQFHLFFPPGSNVLSRSVARDDTRLTRTGIYGKLFAAAPAD